MPVKVYPLAAEVPPTSSVLTTGLLELEGTCNHAMEDSFEGFTRPEGSVPTASLWMVIRGPPGDLDLLRRMKLPA